MNSMFICSVRVCIYCAVGWSVCTDCAVGWSASAFLFGIFENRRIAKNEIANIFLGIKTPEAKKTT